VAVAVVPMTMTVPMVMMAMRVSAVIMVMAMVAPMVVIMMIVVVARMVVRHGVYIPPRAARINLLNPRLQRKRRVFQAVHAAQGGWAA